MFQFYSLWSLHMIEFDIRCWINMNFIMANIDINDEKQRPPHLMLFKNGNDQFQIKKNNCNSPLTVFGGNYPIFLPNHIYLWFYMYTNWLTWIIFFNDCTCYTRNWGGGCFSSLMSIFAIIKFIFLQHLISNSIICNDQRE